MKKFAIVSLSSLALLAVFPACDSHSWEDSEDGKVKGSKHLFEPHAPHGNSDDGGEEKKPH